jgi:hypothetical protein
MDKPHHVRLTPEGGKKEHRRVSEWIQSYNEIATWFVSDIGNRSIWEIVALNNIKIV